MAASRPPVLEMETEVRIATPYVSVKAAPAAVHESAAPLTFYRRRGKRLLDITLGTFLFIGCLPLMVMVAILLLLLSGWPVFYRSERLGRNGRPFKLLKFRTMVNGAHRMLPDLLVANPSLAGEYRETLKLRRDPRRTRIGAVLRRFSIDELPQFWHVITGEMTLVGPRPYAVEEMALLAPHPEILGLTPAVTGPWQVRGRSRLPAAARVALDIHYTENITLSQDLRYMLATVNCLLRPNGQ